MLWADDAIDAAIRGHIFSCDGVGILNSIELSGWASTARLQQLAQLHSLTSLDLGACSAERVGMDLDFSSFYTPSHLPRLPRLVRLVFPSVLGKSSTPLSLDSSIYLLAAYAGQLISLVLPLRHYKQSVPLLQQAFQCYRLQELSVSYDSAQLPDRQITDVSLSRLESLVHLTISNWPLTEAELVHILLSCPAVQQVVVRFRGMDSRVLHLPHGRSVVISKKAENVVPVVLASF